MCGRYFVDIDEDEILAVAIAADAAAYATGACHAVRDGAASRNDAAGLRQSLAFRGGEIFPGASVPALAAGGAVFMKWGFPSALPNRRPHINARSETAASSPTFRESARRRRCLIPATAYFEWKTVEKKQKLKFEFAQAGRRTFYMAAIYAASMEFAILTKAASGTPREYHDRMPVALPGGAARMWFDAPDRAIALSIDDFCAASAQVSQAERADGSGSRSGSKGWRQDHFEL